MTYALYFGICVLGSVLLAWALHEAVRRENEAEAAAFHAALDRMVVAANAASAGLIEYGKGLDALGRQVHRILLYHDVGGP